MTNKIIKIDAETNQLLESIEHMENNAVAKLSTAEQKIYKMINSLNFLTELEHSITETEDIETMLFGILEILEGVRKNALDAVLLVDETKSYEVYTLMKAIRKLRRQASEIDKETLEFQETAERVLNI